MISIPLFTNALIILDENLYHIQIQSKHYKSTTDFNILISQEIGISTTVFATTANLNPFHYKTVDNGLWFNEYDCSL